MIIIIYEIYVILDVLIHLNVEINNTKRRQSPSNDSTNTIKSGSNEGQITVQRGCSNGQMITKYATQQNNILNIIVCINMVTVYRHNGNIFNKIRYICITWIIIIAILSICTHNWYTNSSTHHTLHQHRIILYTINKNIPVTFAIINYYNFFITITCQMYQYYQISNKIGNLNLFIPVESSIGIHVIVTTNGNGNDGIQQEQHTLQQKQH